MSGECRGCGANMGQCFCDEIEGSHPRVAVELSVFEEIMDLALIGYGIAGDEWEEDQKREAIEAITEGDRILGLANEE